MVSINVPFADEYLPNMYRRVRTEELPNFTGFINVTIMEMSFTKLYHQKMLMCAEW